jgi:hypothetical protein
MKNTNKLFISDSAFKAIKNRDLQVLDFNETFTGGRYRVITKCQAGFMVTSVVEASSPIASFRRYKAKAIQSIAFIKYIKGIGEHDFTVYARAGKKVWASECFLREVEVGDINQDLSNTALYNQAQYQAVNAKTWADKAYVMNVTEEIAA